MGNPTANGILMKQCSICKEFKPQSQFSVDRRLKYKKVRTYCKPCGSELSKRYYYENHEKCLSVRKEIRDREDKNKKAIRNKQYRLKNKDKIYTINKKWKAKNRGKLRGYKKKHYILHRKNNIAAKLNDAISANIYNSLKQNKNGRHWEDVVGFNMKELRRHLKRRFKSGMSWKNYGRTGWHIDHIVPISAFNFKSYQDIDFKRCWALSNLQPLWESDNIRKFNKLQRPFQPSMAF